MPAYKRPESVLVVVHTADGEVLLLRRADVPDFWQSVTGSVEAGETPIEAARREVEEETGLDPSDVVDCHRRRRFAIAPEWRARYAPDVETNLEHEFRLGVAVRKRLDLNASEHAGSTWLDVPDAARRASSWTNRAAIRSLDSDPAQTTVVLVHGLWLGPRSMWLLARRLRRAGFHVVLFRWRTTRESPDQAATRLAARLGELDGRVLHFVAHSMGGMVLSRLLSEHAPPRTGRAVLLGSPLHGSAAARGMIRRRLGRLLGAAAGPLAAGGFDWPPDVPVAVMVGVNRCGPGHLFGPLERPNDGTVSLAEARIAGVVPRPVRATHFGLLTSRAVARQTARYLRDGALPCPARRAGDKLRG